MHSIARSSISSLIYLFAVATIVQIVMYLDPHANPARAIELVFFIPGIVILITKILKCIIGEADERAPAAITAIFCGMIPIYMSGEIDRLSSMVGSVGMLIAVAGLVMVVLGSWGRRIFPWLGTALIIHVTAFYLCLVNPTIVNPIIPSAGGVIAIFVLVAFARAIDPVITMLPDIGRPRLLP